jgi:hypothetical protein
MPAQHDWDFHMQPLQPHGIATIPWGHASLPERFWDRTVRMPNGCWHTTEKQPGNFRDLVVQRLLGVNPKEAWRITPTCGSYACVNPAHICVTMETALSRKEK